MTKPMLLAGMAMLSLLTAAETHAEESPISCIVCLQPGMPCRLEYSGSGRVTARDTGLPIEGAQVTLGGNAGGTTDGDGHYLVSASRDDVCNVDYFIDFAVAATGYATFSAPGYFGNPAGLVFQRDVILDENAILAVDPETIELACDGSFVIHLTNTESAGGLPIAIAEIDLFQEYGEGYYGTGFTWDLSGISLPTSLAPGDSLAIPVTYHPDSNGFPSLLHLTVDSDANVVPAFASYVGDVCRTPTPTPSGGPGATSTPAATDTPTPTAAPTEPIPTPTPLSPNLAIDPPTIEIDCSAAFEVQLTNTQSGGIPLVIDDIELFQEYGEGDYGTGFTWDLSGISLPLVLEAQMSVRFPVSYDGADQTYPSLLHITVDSNAKEVAPAFVSYFGGLCGTPTPTVRDTRPTISATPTLARTPTFTVEPSHTATATTSLAGGANTTTSSGGGCRAGSESSAAWIALALLPLLRRKRETARARRK